MDTVALEFAEIIKQKLKSHIKKIVLFGSRARGDFNNNSDYDFLIIVDKKDRESKDIVIEESVNMMDKYDSLIGSIICEESEWEVKKRFPIGLNIQKEGIEL